MTYSVNTAPSTPSTPAITNNCGNTVLTRGNPPTGITWYWQSSSSGTSTSNSSSSVTLTSGSTYYLRARNNSSGCWSSIRTISYSVNAVPPTPSSPTITNNCGNTVLTRGNPPSGITWYWQSSSSGTSTSNSSSSVTRTSGTVYYLRGRNNASGCWGPARTINYTVNSVPLAPDAPSITNNCQNTVLTRGTPPSGITWYWQGSASGTSTSNSNSSVTLTSGSTYYLRARNNSTQCWGPARTINYTISPPFTWYADTDGDGLGDSQSSTSSCTQPSGYVDNSDDYDDETPMVTNIAPQTFYWDSDGDGFGESSPTLYASFMPLGYANNALDQCPDAPGTVNGCDYAPPILSDENYVYTRSYQVPMSSPGSIKENGDVLENVVYYDGLGRPKQQIGIRSSGIYTGLDANTPAGWAMDWTEGAGSTSFFNQNGATEENRRFYAPNPFGQTDLIWECGNQPDNGPDGGWNTDYFNVDNTKTYRYMVWVRRNHSQDGTTYHGTQNVENLGGGSNSNPYFWSGDLPQLGQWYLLVGIVHPYGHSGGDTGKSGVYDMEGNKVLDGTEFKWGSGTTTSRFRSYLYYSTDVNVRQYFYQPILEIVDGNEIPLQDVFRNGKALDVVSHIGYDSYGRQDKEWLPFPEISGEMGSYRGDITTKIQQYHLDQHPEDFPSTSLGNVNAYSQKNFENSPLNRVQEQGAPGKDWKIGNGHGRHFDYQSNVSNEVRRLSVSLSHSNGLYSPTLVNSGYYLAGELYKNIIKDENHISGTDHTTEEFVDKLGRVVLKRTHNNGDHDTYYVYDDYGNLTYVIPPKVTADNVSTTELNELCYQYKYDHRNRLVEKKLPGKGWEHMVYNKLDQPIMTQDSKQDAANEWLFTQYDAFGRVAYTGIDTGNGSTRGSVQSLANGAANQYVERTSTGNNYAGTTVYYTKNAYPDSFDQVFTINYYDSYIDMDGLSVPGMVLGQATASNVTGLATVSKVRVLGTNNWVTTVTGYDLKDRPIYTASKNNYLGTTDIVEVELDFGGRVLRTKSTHTKGTNPSIVTTDVFEYDHIGRLKSQKQTLAGNTETLVENSYGFLGQLAQKKVGGGLQTVDYAYNVRGWLKQINNPANLGNDLFAFGISYNDPSHGGTPLYNGNINETEWRTANTDNSLKWYRYGYDALNRITSATDISGKYNISGILYDKNGNILTLKREGWTIANPLLATNTGFGTMDDLVYSYDDGNKLMKVADGAAIDQFGFKDDAVDTMADNMDDYAYDQNGNLTRDDNKDITSISYNHLNLPTNIAMGSGTISYVYDATGNKLQKTVSVGSTVTAYAGNYVYQDGTLQFFSTPEGYATPDGMGGYDYVYQYKDHLGNIRLSYVEDTNGELEIVEENNYYPFGLKHKGYNEVTSSLGNSVAQKWKYQNQELNESFDYNMYEFELRHYDAALGRFVTTDPYEQFHSPYLAMGNNPVVAFDPDGGNCFDVNGNPIACPDDSLYDDYRDNKNNHITILDEAGGTAEASQGDESSDGISLVAVNSLIGAQVLPKKQTALGRVWATLEPRTVELNGFTYRVNADGEITMIQPMGGAGALALLGGFGSGVKLLKFKGLVQNLSLRSLTHHQLVNAFKGTGLKLSGHAIKRLKSLRTFELGIKNLNDFKQIINKGTKFNAGNGAVGFSHKGVEVIINPKTKVIVTIRPAKNIR
ncbi:DUF6443 domain-containing protein [Muricauda sp. SK9]|uniref:DUF6443 domain-containing protein n=1 Tax=Flavobacteriaceae TaxID=49546 RepID=UPI0015FEE292|nr:MULTISPECIES: DUF6443 domain-containing protein [Allomuricauda]MDC6384607.1 DUF6443 domain-containing protein [Muricauda sp. SK9]